MNTECTFVCVCGEWGLIKSWEWQLLIKSYQISSLWLLLRIISNNIVVLILF